jgi:exopolysaccharide production protein ExoZ
MLVYLQYLRGLAALAVVYFHISLQYNELGLFGLYLPVFGKEGVDVFFVLSGFIICYIAQIRPKAPRAFIWDRIVRVVPLYWFYSALMTTMLILLPEMVKSGQFDLTHIITSFIFMPHAHPIFSEQYWPVVIPGWTLNYEMFFYFIFFCSLYLLKGIRLAFIIITIGSLVALQLLFTMPYPLNFWGNPIVLEFLFGMLLAKVVIKYGAAINIKLSLLVSVLIVLFSCVFFDLNNPFLIGLSAALLVFWVVVINLKTKPINLLVLKLLGDASYSLYLSHIFVISVVNTVCKKLPFENSVNGFIFIILSFSLSIIVGVFSYQSIEKPIVRYFKNKNKNKI